MVNVIMGLVVILATLCKANGIKENLAHTLNIQLTLTEESGKEIFKEAVLFLAVMQISEHFFILVSPNAGITIGFGIAFASIAVYFKVRDSSIKKEAAKLIMYACLGYIGVLMVMQEFTLPQNAPFFLAAIKAQSEGFKDEALCSLITMLFFAKDETFIEKAERWFLKQSIRVYFWWSQRLDKINSLVEEILAMVRGQLRSMYQTVTNGINAGLTKLAECGCAVFDCLASILAPLISRLAKIAACVGVILFLTIFTFVGAVGDSYRVVRPRMIRHTAWSQWTWLKGQVFCIGQSILNKRRRGRAPPCKTG